MKILRCPKCGHTAPTCECGTFNEVQKRLTIVAITGQVMYPKQKEEVLQ